MSHRLGILDWGVGGTGLLRALRERRPTLGVDYWSDTGATPYGRLGRRALAERIGAVLGAMAADGVTHVAVACNSGSTALPDLAPPIPVLGILESGIDAVIEAGRRRVGVVGGERTIRSGIFRRGLEAEGIEVHQRIAQPISALVEAGVVEGASLDEALDRILRPLPRDLDALLLACTHYPAVAGAFARHLPGVALVDPAARLAARVESDWLRGDEAWSRAPDRFVTTGDPHAMRRAAKAAFGVVIERVDRRELERG